MKDLAKLEEGPLGSLCNKFDLVGVELALMFEGPGKAGGKVHLAGVALKVALGAFVPKLNLARVEVGEL